VKSSCQETQAVLMADPHVHLLYLSAFATRHGLGLWVVPSSLLTTTKLGLYFSSSVLAHDTCQVNPMAFIHFDVKCIVVFTLFLALVASCGIVVVWNYCKMSHFTLVGHWCKLQHYQVWHKGKKWHYHNLRKKYKMWH
jgi:hypothetical protein